ncbi:MAG: hypothetical protein ACT443_03640 [Gemmatimonadota bacterium]
MKKRFALLATVVFLAACSENTVEPTELAPSYSQNGGSPAGIGNCHPRTLKSAQQGRITPGSCNFNDAIGRRTQYYQATTPAAGQMLAIRWTGDFAPVLGVKQDTDNPNLGLIHTAFSWDAGDQAGVNFVGTSPTQQVFVSNRDADTYGAFALTSSVEPVSYSCDYPTIYEVPVDLTQQLDAGHSCHVTVQFSPFPEAIGQALHSQFYYGKLIAGTTYNVRIEGVSAAFNPALTIYRGGVVRQSVGNLPANGVRAVAPITPANDRYLRDRDRERESGRPRRLGHAGR